MTRFLPRVLGDPECGSLNEETERLFAYHQATKHTYHSVRTNAHFLDWRNQPNPFRTYEGAPLIALPSEPGFSNAGAFATMADLSEKRKAIGASQSEPGEPVQLDVNWLSRFLRCSMAVSAWKKAPGGGGRYSLRVNPSSGNLHPTETYLAMTGFSGIGDGLYHYRADRHALELRGQGAWTSRIADDLAQPWASESPLIVGLTSIFWREAWKYRDRAYRYCCHDLGHAMMGLLLAARALGLPGGVRGHFSDVRLSHALGVFESDEAPMAFLVFPPQGPVEWPAAPPDQLLAGVPNELSPEEVPYDTLLGMHRSTILPDPAGPLPRIPRIRADDGQPRSPEPLPNPGRDALLGPTVRRRRSALDFDAGTPPMERDDVEQLLDFATLDWPADWRGNFGGETALAESAGDFVTLYLYLHRVRGCEQGVYRWDKSGRSLVQLHRANVERVAAYLSLEQTLAGNACFAASMIADLAEAARIFGNRGYRYAHFEAGAIGQRLYVGAEALGWNATGIGAFYDDDVHRYLGFLEEGEDPVSVSLDAAERGALVMLGSPASRGATAQDRDRLSGRRESPVNDAAGAPGKNSGTLPQQVIYHFAVGRAVFDPRIEA
jgi:SagB-type dehydrogenase family enzyme